MSEERPLSPLCLRRSMSQVSDQQPAHRDGAADVELRIPVVEETAVVEKRVVETGRVRVRTLVERHAELLRDAVTREDAEIERVAVNRVVHEAPAVRTEGDTTIIPLVEEVLVVEKRLIVREEIHIRRRTSVEPIEQEVMLRSTRAVVERDGQDMSNPPSEE